MQKYTNKTTREKAMKNNDENENIDWGKLKNPNTLRAFMEIILIFIITVLALIFDISIKWVLIFGLFFMCSRLGDIAYEIRKIRKSKEHDYSEKDDKE